MAADPDCSQPTVTLVGDKPSPPDPIVLEVDCYNEGDSLWVAIAGGWSYNIDTITWAVSGSASGYELIEDAFSGPTGARRGAMLIIHKDSAESGTVTVEATVKLTQMTEGCSSGWNAVTVNRSYRVVAPEPGDECTSGCGGEDGGPGGQGSGPIGSVKTSNVNGPDVRFPQGLLDAVSDAGFLYLRGESPTSSLVDPATLQVPYDLPGVTVIPSSGTIEQVKAPQGLIRVVDTSPTDSKYDLEVFYHDDVEWNGSLWVPKSGKTPFVTWTVSNPGADTNHLRIASDAGEQFDFNHAGGKWTLSQPVGSRDWVSWKTTSSPYTDWFMEIKTDSQTLKKTQRTYKLINSRQVLTQFSEGDGTNSLVTTYTPYESGNGTGFPKRIDYPDGRWEMFEYDAMWRTVKHYEAYLNMAPPAGSAMPANYTCKLTEYDYLSSVSTNDTYAGAALARTTTVKVPVETSPGNWAWAEVSRLYRSVPSPYEIEEQRCQEPGCEWDDADNLVTTRMLESDPESEDYMRLRHIVHPDGTATIYEYGYIDGSTTFEKTGEPNGSITAIVNGFQLETDWDEQGRVLTRTNRAIVNSSLSTVLSGEAYTYSGDALLRDYEVVDLANRTNEYHFACCGLESMTDPDGVTTMYDYDALDRRVASLRLAGGSAGIKLTNVLDDVGRVLVSRRIGTNGVAIDMDRYQYDYAGRVSRHTNALNGVTTNLYEIVSNRLREITLYPNGGTQTNDYFRDGRLEKVTGTAVAPVRYVYGAEQDGGIWREFTQEIKLAANYTDTSEWVKNYTDSLGRAYKTLYPDSAYEQAFYNVKGQVWKQRDADGVATLYGYNAKGERVTTAVDLDQDGVIDRGGSGSKDWVSDVVTTYTTFSGSPVVQRDVWVFTTDSSAATNKVSTTRTSTDGLKNWQTAYRDQSTAVTTSQVTAYGTSGGRTNTVTNPDSSSTVSIYSYGRLVSVTHKNSSGGQVSQTLYTYDNHGRRFTATDARNGATTFTYNDADQVEAITGPAPGTGDPAQVTTSYYDKQGRSIGQALPDGTTTTNQYYPSGLLKKTWGSRTYPVEYTYDPQGRMKTMKTWQDFAGNGGTATTTWNYHSTRGWLSSKDYPDASTGAAGTTGPDYTYSAGGRLKTRDWARGTPNRVRTTYKYGFDDGTANNEHGELVNVAYDPASTPETTYTHDRRGRRKTAARNSITTTFTYNDANLPLTETYSGGSLGGLSVNHIYNTHLRRTTAQIKQSTTVLQGVTYAYDTAGRLEKVTDASATSYTATYGYEANSTLVNTLTFKQSTTTRMTTTRNHDFIDRLTSISSVASGGSAPSLPVSFAYRYNSANQRTRTTEANGSYWVYNYDSLGQVVSGRKYWADGAPVAGQQFEYGFDDIGNRETTGGRESAVSDYTVNRLNQYSQRTVSSKVDVLGIANPTAGVTVGVSGGTAYTASRKGEYYHYPLNVGNSVYPTIDVKSLYGATETKSGEVFNPPATESFAHDLDGNLTSDGRWTYAWDGENRLIEMKRDTSSPTLSSRLRMTFEYDHQGRRIRKIFFTHNGSSWVESTDTVFLYDGWNLMGELNANASNAKVRTYLWGLDLSGTEQGAGGVGGLLKVTDYTSGTTHHFVAYDGNGNVAALVDGTSGAITARYEYGLFGEPLRATGSLGEKNPIRFSSKYTDAHSGLLYYGYRYYNPLTGRWPSRDALGEMGGLNLLAFINNAVTGYIDDLGRAPAATAPFSVNDFSSSAFPMGAQAKAAPKTVPPKPAHPGGGQCPNNLPTANGCGTDDWLGRLIPEKPGGADFTKACDNHDRCYVTCGSNKMKCDIRFWDDLLDECARKFGWNHAFDPPPPDLELKRKACEKIALLYANAVWTRGQPAYDAAQIEGCKCRCDHESAR